MNGGAFHRHIKRANSAALFFKEMGEGVEACYYYRCAIAASSVYINIYAQCTKRAFRWRALANRRNFEIGPWNQYFFNYSIKIFIIGMRFYYTHFNTAHSFRSYLFLLYSSIQKIRLYSFPILRTLSNY